MATIRDYLDLKRCFRLNDQLACAIIDHSWEILDPFTQQLG